MNIEPFLVGASAVLIMVVDQFSKALAARRPSERRSPTGPWLRFRRVMNRRTGFVRASRRHGLALWALAVVAASLSLSRGGGSLTALGMGLAIGGATSNLFDRLLRGAVVDFIDVRYWAVFNVADVAIVVGIGLALVSFSG